MHVKMYTTYTLYKRDEVMSRKTGVSNEGKMGKQTVRFSIYRLGSGFLVINWFRIGCSIIIEPLKLKLLTSPIFRSGFHILEPKSF